MLTGTSVVLVATKCICIFVCGKPGSLIILNKCAVAPPKNASSCSEAGRNNPRLVFLLLCLSLVATQTKTPSRLLSEAHVFRSDCDFQWSPSCPDPTPTATSTRLLECSSSMSWRGSTSRESSLRIPNQVKHVNLHIVRYLSQVSSSLRPSPSPSSLNGSAGR